VSVGQEAQSDRGEGGEDGWKDYFSPSEGSNKKVQSRVIWEDEQEDGWKRKEEREMSEAVNKLKAMGAGMFDKPGSFGAAGGVSMGRRGADADEDARQAEVDLAEERDWARRRAQLFDDVGGTWSSPEA
jgi:hypothetical protein